MASFSRAKYIYTKEFFDKSTLVKIKTHALKINSILSSVTVTTENLRNFAESYIFIVSSLTSDIVDKLKLYLDDELGKKLNHMISVAEISLSAEGPVYFEGRKLDSDEVMADAPDVFIEDPLEIIDVTASFTAQFHKSWMLKLRYPWAKKIRVELIKPYEGRINNMRHILKEIANAMFLKDHLSAVELTFLPRNKKLSTLIPYQILEDKVVQGLSVIDLKERRVDQSDIQELSYLVSLNDAATFRQYLEMFSSDSSVAALKNYTRLGMLEKHRDLMRLMPTADGEIKEGPTSDLMSEFMVKLWLEGEMMLSGWYAYDGKFRAVDSKIVANKKGAHFYGVDQPHLYIRRYSERSYEIIFNLETFLEDYHLVESILRWTISEEEKSKKRSEHKPKFCGEISTEMLLKSYVESVKEIEMNSEVLNIPPGAIFRKLFTNAKTLPLVEKAKEYYAKTEEYLSVIFRTKFANSMSHEYEVGKSVAFSFKTPAGVNRYFLSKNGSANSISLIQRNCTADSFTNVFVITTNWCPERNEYICGKSISFNKNTLAWALRKPMISFSTITWMVEERLTDCVLGKNFLFEATTMLNIISVNRDSFAQVSEQTRYLYTAALNFSSSLTEGFAKIADLCPVSAVEIYYTFNLVKVATCLNALKFKGVKVVAKKGEPISFVMPQDRLAAKDFSYFISSMYISRLYNKEKAFPEPSSARCYQGVLDEIEIYNKSEIVKTDIFEDISKKISKIDLVLAKTGTRYNAYAEAVATLAGEIEKTVSVRETVYRSTTNPFLTNRAAMRGSHVRETKQNTRSFDTAIRGTEELLGVMKGYSSTIKIYYLQAVAFLKKFLYRNAFDYCSYIVHKDQVGNREIYVMNFYMRLGTYFVEEVARAFSKEHMINMQSNPSKEEIMESIMWTCHKRAAEDEEKDWEIYDNADSKRWGPNQRMDVFSMLIPMLIQEEEYDVIILSLFTFDMMARKKVKAPHCLIEYAKKYRFKLGRGYTNSFVRDNLRLLLTEEPAVVEPMGMGQGIFQEFSSVLHAIKQEFEMRCIERIIGYRLVYRAALVTSDDSFKVLCYRRDINESVTNTKIFEILQEVADRTGSYFSILRNRNKSGFSLYCAEFNSRFYFKRSPGLPTLKFRNAKIDCGMGNDPFKDLVSVLGSASDYLSFGGSYLGAVAIMVTTYTFYLEQWRETLTALSDRGCTISVGGKINFIEPLTAAIFGPFMHTIMSDIVGNNVKPSRADLHAAAMNLSLDLMSKYEVVHLPAIRSIEETITEELLGVDVESFYSGICTLSRTPRFRSAFSKSGIEEENEKIPLEITLGKRMHSVSAQRFAVELRARQNIDFDDEVDLHKRFAEPWLSRNRVIYIRSNSRIGTAILGTMETFNHEVYVGLTSGSTAAANLLTALFKDDEKMWKTYPADLFKYSECWEERLASSVEMILVLKNITRNLDHLIKRPMPRLISRALIIPSVTTFGFPEFAVTMASKTLGIAGNQLIFEYNEALGVKLERQQSEVSVKDFIRSMTTLEANILRFLPPRRKVLIPWNCEIATPGEVAIHSLRDKFIEGAGYSKGTARLMELESLQRHEVILISEAETLMRSVGVVVSEHLNEIFLGVETDLIFKLRSNTTLCEKLDESIRAILPLKQHPIRKLTLKILHSAITEERMTLTPEEKSLIAMGKISPFGMVSYKNYNVEFFSNLKATTSAGEVRTAILQHVVRSNQWEIVFIVSKSKSYDRTAIITLEDDYPRLGLKSGEIVTDGFETAIGNFCRVIFEEELGSVDIVASTASSILGLKLTAHAIIIPTIALSPDSESLECMKSTWEKQLEALEIVNQANSEMTILKNPFNPRHKDFIRSDPTVSFYPQKIRPNLGFKGHLINMLRVLKTTRFLGSNPVSLQRLATRPFKAPWTPKEAATIHFSTEEEEEEHIERVEVAPESEEEFEIDEYFAGVEVDWDEILDQAELEFGDDMIEGMQPEFFEKMFLELGPLLSMDLGGRVKPLELSRASAVRSFSTRNFVLSMRKAIKKNIIPPDAETKTLRGWIEDFGEQNLLAMLLSLIPNSVSEEDKIDILAYLVIILTVRV